MLKNSKQHTDTFAHVQANLITVYMYLASTKYFIRARDLVPEMHFDKKKLKGKYFVEPKYDGFRCVTFINADGKVTFMSRNKKQLYNIEHIEEELKEVFKDCNVVLDGEMLAKNWNETAKIIRKQTHHSKALTLSYNIFDVIYRREWGAIIFVNVLKVPSTMHSTRNRVLLPNVEVSRFALTWVRANERIGS